MSPLWGGAEAHGGDAKRWCAWLANSTLHRDGLGAGWVEPMVDELLKCWVNDGSYMANHGG